MEDTEFLTISTLFDSIGIIEKGIEKIYHYLLVHNKIENLKEVCEQFDLTLKRGYKICSVLNDLELVQIFDRPMKIHLIPDLIPVWQKLVIKRIEQLKNEYHDKKYKCETALEEFFQTYNVKEVVQSQEPVEFINFSANNFEELYYPFTAENECKIALGIGYENALITILQNNVSKDIPDEIKETIKIGMKKTKENLEKISVKVIFNEELVRLLIKSTAFKTLGNHLDMHDLKFKDFRVHVTDENFSNFSLTDNELIQPSFDPSNKLIGAYISRNKNIYQIFYDKFNEIFEKGIPINEFVKKDKELSIDSFSDIQAFILSLL